MTRFALAALSMASLGAALAGAQQPPAFRAGADTVSVYATVVDRAGRLVPDLSKDDFEVFDNGKRQDITVFASDIQPITIVVMLDRSGSMEPNFRLVRDAAVQFIANLLPADRVRLGNFSYQVDIAPATFTSNRDELLRILHDELQDAGPTPLWNATSAAMSALASEKGRRVVLLFTDGKDSPDGPGPNSSFEDVRDRSQLEEVMIYGIGLANTCDDSEQDLRLGSGQMLFQSRGRGGIRRPPPRIPDRGIPGRGIPGRGIPGRGIPGRGIPEMPGRGGGRPPAVSNTPCVSTKPDPQLKKLAEEGGGAYFELRRTDDLATTFSRVAEELHHQYLLGFSPSALDGRTHKLEVRLRQPEMTARARRSYVATAER